MRLMTVSWVLGHHPLYAAANRAPPFAPGFQPADHRRGLADEGGEDLVGILLRVLTRQTPDREIDDFMTVPRSRPG